MTKIKKLYYYVIMYYYEKLHSPAPHINAVTRQPVARILFHLKRNTVILIQFMITIYLWLRLYLWLYQPFDCTLLEIYSNHKLDQDNCISFRWKSILATGCLVTAQMCGAGECNFFVMKFNFEVYGNCRTSMSFLSGFWKEGSIWESPCLVSFYSSEFYTVQN